jgi:hypothetical protein
MLKKFQHDGDVVEVLIFDYGLRSGVEWLTYLSKHFTFIDKIWINKDRYDRKRLFGKAGQGKANQTCHSV